MRDLRLMRRGDGSLYDIPVPGYKANLSDVLAAIALCQLDKLDRHAEIRRRQFAAYDEAVAELDGITPLARDDRDVHALHLYIVRIDAERAGATRDEYQRALRRGAHRHVIHFLPVHQLRAIASGFPTSRRCRSPSAQATRCCRCRSRPRTRTTTSRTRSRRSAASTSGSRDGGGRVTIGFCRRSSITGGCLAYILWKLDLGETLDILVARAARLVRGRGRDHDRAACCRWRGAGSGCSRRAGCTSTFAWLTRAYFVGYTAGQVLPTAVGGDASRIFETSRRHPGRLGA